MLCKNADKKFIKYVYHCTYLQYIQWKGPFILNKCLIYDLFDNPQHLFQNSWWPTDSIWFYLWRNPTIGYVLCTSMCTMYMMTFPPLLFTPALEANTTAEMRSERLSCMLNVVYLAVEYLHLWSCRYHKKLLFTYT